MTVVNFLALTFAISLAGFAVIAAVPAARSPDAPLGLPFWLVMVWGPTLAAIVLSWRTGELGPLLARAVQVAPVQPAAWVLVACPIVLLLLMRPMATGAPVPLGAGMLLAMVALNLCLGPLGEELGWRGVLQPKLAGRMGWLAASLAVGAIWLVWHLPLWTIDSPHAQIRLVLFAGHCMAYAVIIGAAWRLSGGSLIPAVGIHLTVNLAANLALFSGFPEPDDWFAASLPAYAALALAAVVLVYLRTGDAGWQAGTP